MFRNVLENETWKLVFMFDRRTTLPFFTHALLKIKLNDEQNPAQFIARVGAGGNLQAEGQDYDIMCIPVEYFTLILFASCLRFFNAREALHV